MISISLLIFSIWWDIILMFFFRLFFWVGWSMVSFSILNTFIIANFIKSLSGKSNVWAYSRQFLLIAFFPIYFFIYLSLSQFKTEWFKWKLEIISALHSSHPGLVVVYICFYYCCFCSLFYWLSWIIFVVCGNWILCLVSSVVS